MGNILLFIKEEHQEDETSDNVLKFYPR